MEETAADEGGTEGDAQTAEGGSVCSVFRVERAAGKSFAGAENVYTRQDTGGSGGSKHMANARKATNHLSILSKPALAPFHRLVGGSASFSCPPCLLLPWVSPSLSSLSGLSRTPTRFTGNPSLCVCARKQALARMRVRVCVRACLYVPTTSADTRCLSLSVIIWLWSCPVGISVSYSFLCLFSSDLSQLICLPAPLSSPPFSLHLSPFLSMSLSLCLPPLPPPALSCPLPASSSLPFSSPLSIPSLPHALSLPLTRSLPLLCTPAMTLPFSRQQNV